MKGNAQDADIAAYVGSSGSGKTTRMVKRVRRRKWSRSIIWSPKEAKDNYAAVFPGSVVVSSVAEVLGIVRAAGPRGRFHIVFRPALVRKRDEAQFDVVCRIALEAGSLLFLADELHTVTRGSWAPDGWSQLVMMGRAYGIAIVAGSQRPASMDKDFLGNCSLVNTGRLVYEDDAKAVAKALRATPADVLALSGYSWLERDVLTGKTTRG